MPGPPSPTVAAWRAQYSSGRFCADARLCKSVAWLDSRTPKRRREPRLQPCATNLHLLDGREVHCWTCFHVRMDFIAAVAISGPLTQPPSPPHPPLLPMCQGDPTRTLPSTQRRNLCYQRLPSNRKVTRGAFFSTHFLLMRRTDSPASYYLK